MNSNGNSTLGQYVREVFDLNKDGKVTLKEFFATLIPNYAVGIAFIVVDALMAVAEYRVWDVGMKITGDAYKALGFVLVSALPFYLAQILWLYPRANGWQQSIAVGMAVTALYTSAQFGLADLTARYDVDRLIRYVIYLSGGYVVSLLVYILIDKNIRLMRAKVTAREQANFQGELNTAMRSILSDLRQGLAEEKKLRDEYGDLAVDSHLELMRGMSGNRDRLVQNNNHSTPVNPPEPPRH